MIYAIILFAVLACFFGVGYYLNSRTPKPEGCENITENCEGCKINSCVHHPSRKEKI